MKQYDKYTISREQAGLTVEAYLRQIVGCPGRRLQKLTRAKGILLNGKGAFLQRQLKAGDVLQVLILTDLSYGVLPEAGEVKVLYEDEAVIVLDKPAGQLVHPAGQTEGGTLANALAYYFQSQGILTAVRALHRLDRDTSGCVLFAKDAKTQTELEKQLQSGGLKRTYLAVVHGTLEQAEGTVDAPIGSYPGRANRRMVRPDGERAVTHYQVLEAFPEASLLELRLETGRTHQIRVHLAHLGHPVIGDGMYGRRSPLIDRQALHAAEVGFNHPRTGEAVTVKSSLPADLTWLLEHLRADKEK